MSSYGYKDYVPASIKKARAAKSIDKLRKKNPNLAPVQISGRKLAKTWWGIAWNENLERYADYANRIDRGRSYVRQGSVIDLQIEPGKVKALVQGTRVTPYKVEIYIQPLKPLTWDRVFAACTGSISSLQDLISGKFPQNLAELFTARGEGLFPTPKEISMTCSCPDWAPMCKHVAAPLYGVGARLDEDPALFFRLRQVDIDELITHALDQTSDTLLERSQKKSRRALDHADLSGLFGIDIADPGTSEPQAEEAAAPAGSQQKRANKAVRQRKPAEQPAAVKQAVMVKAAGEQVIATGKKRGRPRKTPLPEPSAESSAKPSEKPAVEPATAEKPATAKKRGRPRKNDKIVDA